MLLESNVGYRTCFGYFDNYFDQYFESHFDSESYSDSYPGSKPLIGSLIEFVVSAVPETHRFHFQRKYA